jgi:hypothetical protein
MNNKLRLLLAIFFGLNLYHLSFASSSTFSGHFSYTISNKTTNPSADEADAYAKIQLGMDSAVWFYNTYTTITKKLTIEYKPGEVQTADGSSNGNIRFGKNRTYMKGCTCMHEIAHTTGIGTTSQWTKLIVNKVFKGKNATQKLKEILGSQDSVLHGDNQHFWPFGLNYDYEAKSIDDLIRHCLIVNAIQKDIFPTPVAADETANLRNNLSIVMNSGNMVTYTIPLSGFITIGIYSVSGQKLADLKQGQMGSGSHSISVNNVNLPYGKYIFQLTAGQKRQGALFAIVKNDK